MSGWRAFRNGLLLALHYWQGILALFLVNLSSALLLLMLIATNLLEASYRTAIRQVADGLDFWLILEMLYSMQIDHVLGVVREQVDLVQGIGLIVGLLLAISFLAVIPTAFLRGGMLFIFAEAPNRFRWRHFFWGGWHWFGAFLLLFFLYIFIFWLLVISGGMTIFLFSNAERWLQWVGIAIIVLFLGLWPIVTDCTATFAVLSDTRNIFRNLLRAIAFVFRHPLAMMGLYIPATLLLILVHLLFRWGIQPNISPVGWMFLLVINQLFIVSRLWLRLARMAGSISLLKAVQKKVGEIR